MFASIPAQALPELTPTMLAAVLSLMLFVLFVFSFVRKSIGLLVRVVLFVALIAVAVWLSLGGGGTPI